MSYIPPSGDNVEFDFAEGLPTYNPPSGDNVAFDFAADPDISNPYVDTNLSAEDSDVADLYGVREFTNSQLLANDGDNLSEIGGDLWVIDSALDNLVESDGFAAYGIPEFYNFQVLLEDTENSTSYADHYIADSELLMGDQDSLAAWGTWDYWYSSLGMEENDTLDVYGEMYVVDSGISSSDEDGLSAFGLREFENKALDMEESDELIPHSEFFLQSIDFFDKDSFSAYATTIQNEGNVLLGDSDELSVSADLYAEEASLILEDIDELLLNGYYDTVYTRSILSDQDSLLTGGDHYVHAVALTLSDIDTADLQPLEDYPPEFTSSPTTAVAVGGSYTYTPVAVDDYSVPTISLGVHPAFLAYSDGVLSGQPGYADAGFHTVTLYATDSIGTDKVQLYELEVVSPFRTDDLAGYEDWLKSAYKKIVAIEMASTEWTTITTRRYWFTDFPYISKPTDTLPNKSFSPYIKEIPAFSREVKTDLSGAETSWGEITLFNNSSLDSLVSDEVSRYQEIVIKMGNTDSPYNDFVTIMNGRLSTKGAYADSLDEIHLPIRSNSVLLDVPLSTDRFEDDDLLNPGEYKPQCWGGDSANPVFNIVPVLVDSSSLRYKYHTGRTGGVVAVRDLGVDVSYVDFPLVGEFELVSPPSGDITADVIGGYSDEATPTLYNDVSSLVYRLVLEKTEIDSDMLDTTSFTKLWQLYGDVVVGFYFSKGNDSTVREVVDWMLSSINSFCEFRRDGRLYVRELLEPGFVNKASDIQIDYTFTGDDIGPDIEIEEVISAQESVSFGWRRNWFPQSTFADYINTERLDLKTLYENEYSTISIDNTEAQARLVKPDPVTTYVSLILDESSAQRIAEVRAAYSNTYRTVYRLDMYKLSMLLNLGDIVKIDVARFGLSDYPGVVVGVDDPVITGKGVIKVLK